MKKVLLTLIVCFVAISASAQTWDKVETAFTTQDRWAVGGRIGTGLQAQAEYVFDNENYVEGRFGMSWCNWGATLMADFTALYQWHIFDMDWTPSAGDWFFDAGAGVGVGGRANYCYVGAAGSVKLGIKFNKAPVKLALDWTPLFGAEIAYWKGFNASAFHKYGLANIGVSCVYCF